MIKDEELEKDLLRVQKIINKIPSMLDYKKHGKFDIKTFLHRNTWNKWLLKLFNNTNQLNNSKLKTPNEEEFINDLKNIYKITNRVPSKKAYIELGKLSIYKFAYKHWTEWLKLAFGENFERTNSMKISHEEMLEDLKKIYLETNKLPSKSEYVNNGGKFTPMIFLHEKPWAEWLKELNPNAPEEAGKACKKISNEELILNLKELTEKIGHIPLRDDLILGKYSVNAYKRAFGSFGKALIAAELTPNQVRGLTDEEILEDIKYVYNKLNRIPTTREFAEHSKYQLGEQIIYNRFDSWKDALIKAGLPYVEKPIITKDVVIKDLTEWYKKNNNDVACLEYWKIRHAKDNNLFPYSTYFIFKAFEDAGYGNIQWHEIMNECGFVEYKNINQFKLRRTEIGQDGYKYLSAIERDAGNFLYELKLTGDINNYEYNAKVCLERLWTCDFKIYVNNAEIWLEIDGMRNNRKYPYNSGQNEKIEYYKANNYNYKIISYNNRDLKNSILNIIKCE